MQKDIETAFNYFYDLYFLVKVNFKTSFTLFTLPLYY